LYISQAVRKLSASAAQKREVTFMDRKKSRPATSDRVIRGDQLGSIERIEAGSAATVVTRTVTTPISERH
jgi:hypothetical protein